MKLSDCRYRCKQVDFRKSVFVKLLVKEIEKIYGVKLKKCEDFCKFYVLFLSVAEMLYGKYYNYSIFKAIVKGKPNLYMCVKCEQPFTAEESITHTLQHMKALGYNPLAYKEEI